RPNPPTKATPTRNTSNRITWKIPNTLDACGSTNSFQNFPNVPKKLLNGSDWANRRFPGVLNEPLQSRRLVISHGSTDTGKHSSRRIVIRNDEVTTSILACQASGRCHTDIGILSNCRDGRFKPS